MYPWNSMLVLGSTPSRAQWAIARVALAMLVAWFRYLGIVPWSQISYLVVRVR